MKRFSGILVIFILSLLAATPRAAAQGVIQTGTGLGVQKVKLAVPEFASRNLQTTPLEKTFHQVLMDDLNYSGIIDMVSPSFYPASSPSVPGELNAEQWSQAPANAWMVAFGNLTVNGSSLALAGYLYDVRQTPPLSILEKI
ncbi:MAG TPA: translocation protein TolB, partial [Candidatus Paceibacterota bacterium]|nr:translocation protein TolB [Candidatus Paceibacterota bacterium]